jgi:predicted RNA-binding Zn-ribbon protein involved in translation (DUF1610 family)
MATEELHTDGNQLAGLLQEVFVAEMTSAPRACQSCGRQHAIGEHRLYTGAGFVLRCPSCGDLAACVTVLPDQYVLHLRGTWRIARAR